MPRNRFVPVALALALAGCGSVGAIGLPPMTTAQPTEPVEMGGLPPAVPEEQQTAALPPAGQDVPVDPNAPAGVGDAAALQPAPSAASGGGGLGRTDLLGGWTISSGGDSCQLFMTLTSWTGGYRASTRGCSNAVLKSISAWNLEGKQVILAGTGGAPVARLSSSGNNRFDGQAAGAGAVTFYR